MVVPFFQAQLAQALSRRVENLGSIGNYPTITAISFPHMVGDPLGVSDYLLGRINRALFRPRVVLRAQATPFRALGFQAI